jgi:hypothetical protein
MWKWKRSKKFVWELPDGICFWGQKWKLTPVRPIPSVIQKEKSLICIFQKSGGQIFHLDSHEITADGKSVFLRYEVLIRKKSINFFLAITKSVLYITFIESKKRFRRHFGFSRYFEFLRLTTFIFIFLSSKVQLSKKKKKVFLTDLTGDFQSTKTNSFRVDFWILNPAEIIETIWTNNWFKKKNVLGKLKFFYGPSKKQSTPLCIREHNCA